MRAITFLGIANYARTTYVFEGKQHPTQLFPVALCHFLRPSELLVVVTEAAQAKWFEALQVEVEGPLGIPCTPVPIPDGHSEADLWTIFTRLTAQLEEGEEVIFDITHSFRTLPLLTLLAASFLRVTRNIKVSGLYYGAWEARRPPPPPGQPLVSNATDLSPVFNLTPFLSLLELTTATDQFLKTGNAGKLAPLLTDGVLKENITHIAEGLNLIRPLEVMQRSSDLSTQISFSAGPSPANSPAGISLLQRIAADYGQFALADPYDYRHKSRASLYRQLQIIRWYIEKSQYTQAISMAREWPPSLLCWHFQCDPFRRQNRLAQEKILNGRGSQQEIASIPPPLLADLIDLWSGVTDLANLRNDVLHAGFRSNPKPPMQIIAQIEEILTRLEQIALDWQIVGEAP